MRPALVLLALALVLIHATSNAKPDADQVPLFSFRARVISSGKAAPTENSFAVRLAESDAKIPGGAWSEWIDFDRDSATKAAADYPNSYLREKWPLVLRARLNGITDPAIVEAEIRLVETSEIIPVRAELMGPNLGLVLWRDETGKPCAASMTDYNRRYWKALEATRIPAEELPRHFPIIDRFIGGDDDRIGWRAGLENLSRAGFNALMLPPDPRLREMLHATGLRRTSWAVYNPPGYAFDFDPQNKPEPLDEWAQKQARPFLDAGYAPEEIAVFTMSDEPGWYYPHMLDALAQSPAALERFRRYLQSQGLTPGELGAADWSNVQPLGRSGAGAYADLPARKCFYWTMRFFAHDSARHFAAATRALESAFRRPGLPIITNWNFFSSRLYVPGPVANNRAKQSPDAAMGGHDWLEFGAMRGGTMLWTEDWFSDAQAPQWSFYCAKLASAARLGGVEFGGYVIPRTAGQRPGGIVQKILTLVGSGGKCVKYFVFGPEYVFPKNCYSENLRVLPEMAEAHRIIGRMEDVLWPGKRLPAQVAIVFPRSAQMWDERSTPIPNSISDATNTDPNTSTTDYLAEIFNLYTALQHANISCDFLDEDRLADPAHVAPYQVIYLTAPNLPVESQRALAEWTRRGGTLVTTSGAAAFDRYDAPSTVLVETTGIREEPRPRLILRSLADLSPLPQVQFAASTSAARGPRTKLHASEDADTLAWFSDNSPALIRRPVGQGRVFHFPWLPGLSYAQPIPDSGLLPTGYDPGLRRLILHPVELAHIRPHVALSEEMVEAPMLISDAGAAVTLLNWTGQKIANLTVSAEVDFTPREVVSAHHGTLKWQRQDDRILFELPLDSADVIALRR